MKIINVVGARPNFMKIAPIVKAMREREDVIQQYLVHTGQHYDHKMSKAFFDDLGMPKPDIDLNVGSASHGEQTAKVMLAFEQVCEDIKPDLVVVVGDVNSTIACALTAKKLGIKVAHVEAGLRSYDMDMPEEINRLCTDAICDYLFTTDLIANANLIREGVSEERIHFVGNVMIDTLLSFKQAAQALRHHEKLGHEAGAYATLTLHRPSNVDDRDTFLSILKALSEISDDVPILFPIHPRTSQRVEELDLKSYFSETNIHLIEPLGYLEFLSLNINARLVVTDSGGLQEETTILGVPCITLRENTERPITVEQGTNRIAGTKTQAIMSAYREVCNLPQTNRVAPEKWDGKAAERIVEILAK